MKNGLDEQYIDLLTDILENGVEKNTRNGKVLSVFGRTIRYKFKDGKFPLLTTKKMAWKSIVTELLWFLRGETNIKYLVDNDCHIWDGDAYKNYRSKSKDVDLPQNLYNKLIDDLNKDAMFPIDNPSRMLTKEEFINRIKTDDEFAKKWGELGPIYGKQWRKWNNYFWEYGGNEPYGEGGNHLMNPPIDQIANLINDLKTNPDSRRLMVSAWNVGELDQMVLPPCHYEFQVYTRELSLEEKKKMYGLLFEEWETAKNNFQSYAMKVTYGEANDIQYNTEQANHWDSIYKKLSEQIKQLPTRAISLMWNQRSVDTFLGLPFNIASYGLLLEIIAKEVNMVPDELIGNLGDVHLYSNHVEQAKEQIGRELTWEEQVQWVMKNTDVEMENLYIVEEIAKDSTPKYTREPYPLPILKIEDGFDIVSGLDDIYEINSFTLENYQSHPAIKAPLSN